MLRNKMKRDVEKLRKGNKKKKSRKEIYEVRASVLKESLETEEKDDEEKELERLVFGGEDDVLEELCSPKVPSPGKRSKSAHIIKRTRKAAWEDEDDDDIMVESTVRGVQKDESYAKHLRKRLLDNVGTPRWAELDKPPLQESDDSDDEIFQTSSNLLSTSQPLTSGTLDVRYCRDLNHEGWTKGILKSTEFHPSSQVALVANCNGTVTLFQVDGKTNAKIQAVHFERFSIESAHFTTDGEQVIAGSPDQNYLYCYDMMVGKIVKVPWAKGIENCSTQKLYVSPDAKHFVICGRFGEMHLLTVKSKEWVGSLKMNGEVRSIAFSKDGQKMYSNGDGGKVYVWDVNSRRCLSTFFDEGCTTGTALAVSPNDQYLATGSDSGVVNVYSTSDLHKTQSPTPIKAVLNLTTEVTSLKFNHSSEVLAMASSFKDNAVKLLHVPTTSVFPNFPVEQQNFRRINCLDISLNSGYLTLGSNMGRASLFRLKHYSNY